MTNRCITGALPEILNGGLQHKLIHRYSQGVQWVHVHPQGKNKKLWGLNLEEVSCKCISRRVRRVRSQSFEEIWEGWGWLI